MNALTDAMRNIIDAARVRFCQQTRPPLQVTLRQRHCADAVLCVTLYGKKGDNLVFLSLAQLKDTLTQMNTSAPGAPVASLAVLMGVEVFVVADIPVQLVNDPDTHTLKGQAGGEIWLTPPAIEGVYEDYDHRALYLWQGTTVDNTGRKETVDLYEIDYFLYWLIQQLPASHSILQQVSEKVIELAAYDEKTGQAFRQDIDRAQRHLAQRMTIVN